MSVEFEPLPGPFGFQVTIHDGIDDEVAEAIRVKFVESGLLLFRGLDLSHEEHIALTRILGEPEIHPLESVRLKGHPEIIVLGRPAPEFSDDDPQGDKVVGTLEWHTDLTYTVRPGKGALLYCEAVPPEMGQTRFINTAAVYDALPDDVKERIEGLEALHSFKGVDQYREGDDKPEFDFPEFPEVIHPLVYTHPGNGRKVLNVSPLFTRKILGMDEAQGDKLLDWLKSFATGQRFIYSHDWQVGDVMAWDNWQTMHSAAGFKLRHTRMMYRTTLLSDFDLGRLAA